MKRLLIGCLMAALLLVGIVIGQSAEPGVLSGVTVDNCPAPERGHSAICTGGAAGPVVSVNGGTWQPLAATGSGTSSSSGTSGGSLPANLSCDISFRQITTGPSGSYMFVGATLTNCH